MARGRDLKTPPIGDERAFEEVQRAYWTWSEYNEEMLRQIFTSIKVAEEYASWGAVSYIGERYLEDEVRDLHAAIDEKLRKLGSINERLELIPIAPGIGHVQPAPQGAGIESAKVFLVHGHDEGVREAVARFLGKLSLNPVILHEQASQGRTIVEKLEHHGDVGYAVVLLTPDDVGGSSSKDLQARARQNVVLELGYFVGRLGRERVCALHRGDLELPSDYMGVIYVPFDVGGGWRLGLAKELKAAGFSIDMNKAL